MAGNRKAFEAYVLEFMGALTEGGGNKIIYERLFAKLNDKQIEEMVVRIEQGSPLSVWVSNWNKKEMIQFSNIQKLAKKYGILLEQRIIVKDPETGITSMSPYKATVGTIPVRKQRQMQVTKFSYAMHDYDIDDLTGQVTGDSRSTGISQPEITVLRNMGLETMANELYNVKGGDLDALKAYKNSLITTGSANVNAALRSGTIAKVLSSVHFLFRGRHIDTNFNKRYG
jgi:hypothetical protein